MNVLSPKTVATDAACRKVADPNELAENYAAYMTDESRLDHSMAEAIYFPTTTEETACAVRQAAAAGDKIVVSGGRTGIVGGAVVAGPCAIISLEKIKPKPVVRSDNDRWLVKTGAGTTVAELADAVRSENSSLFYPVDPTEMSAQLGGTVATNASGARTLFYGPTRKLVKSITVVLADGRVLDLRRGEVTADGLKFEMEDADGNLRTLALPDFEMPRTKSTVGYFIEREMDAVDLFVGCEGTLGIITEMELLLAESPSENLYLCQYFDGEDRALDFVMGIMQSETFSPLAVEYFDGNSVDLLRRKRQREGASSGVPILPEDVRVVVYTEFALNGPEEFEETAGFLMDLIASVGGCPEKSWAGCYRKDLEKRKAFRHTLPEEINSIIGQRKVETPEIHKVGTDMAVPLEGLREMMSVYRSSLEKAGLEHVIFGHIGSGHLHVNILPRSAKEVGEAKKLYMGFAREAVRLGGSVSAEHGIGRIKRDFLLIQYGEEIVRQMRNVKTFFDPAGTLNPGVLFEG